jgi:DNA-binding GntR family transcriptional regulator
MEFVTTKTGFAYGRLREMIMAGDVAPGEVLNQAELARVIGISTTPLREALRRLNAEGLVDLDAHRDARVTALTAEEAQDLLEIRASLDPLAVALAAERRSAADIHEMRDAIRGLRPLPDSPAFADLVTHRRFHTAIYTASRNEILISTLDGLWDKADRYRRLALAEVRDQAERERTAIEHDALLNCVINRDAAGAAEVMRQHIGASLGAKAAERLHAGLAPATRNPERLS